MSIHELIDKFVHLLDERGSDFCRIESAPWIEVLETKLPRQLPASFRSLVTRYTFPEFVIGGISFYENKGADSPDELSGAIFKDRIMAGVMLKCGYLQFARPESGSYDPICFAARRQAKNREFPIVRLDHEAILCRGQIRVVSTPAESFYRLVADFVDQA